MKKIFDKNNPISLNLMMIPGLLFLFIFSYIPIFGLLIAFMDFNFVDGVNNFFKPNWVGLQNFKELFIDNSEEVFRVIFNTVKISFLKIISSVVFPVAIAILVSEIKNKVLKNIFNTVMYIPHFLSWVVLGEIAKQTLLSDGYLNLFIKSLGFQSVHFLTDNRYYTLTIVILYIIKEFGFQSIVYMGCISNINENLYSISKIDGANRFQQIIYITLPSMVPVILLMFILSMDNILSGGFEQIFNTYSVKVYKSGDILDTYIYRNTFQNSVPDYSLSTALSLFKSTVSGLLILLSYKLASKIFKYKVF